LFIFFLFNVWFVILIGQTKRDLIIFIWMGGKLQKLEKTTATKSHKMYNKFQFMLKK